MKEYLSIQEHAWKLSLVFESIQMQTYNDRWTHISEWLHMASGVLNVDIDTQIYNTDNLFCGFATDFEETRSKLWSNFCSELTTLNFIWGSLESLIEEITGAREEDSKPKFGKEYLKANYTQVPIDKYICVLSSLKKLITHSTYPNRQKILNKTVMRSNNPGTGLHIVSKIRNLLAHGCISLPQPDGDWMEQINIDLGVVRHCSRIILLTIQMMVIAHFSKNDLLLEHLYMFDGLSDFHQLSVTVFLKNLHLYKYQTLLT